jgi:hypothetical protein
MKKLIASAILLLVSPLFASAQNADHPYHVEGYLLAADEAKVGPAGGGGVEGLSSDGFGLGGEYVKAASPFDENLVSVNLFYHFGASKNHRKFEPFVTGGYTHFSIPNITLGPASGGNFGCGANIWLTRHAALRLELRDTIGGRSISTEFDPSGSFYTAPNNVVSFRIGVTFR